MTVSSTISRSGPYAGAGTTGPFAVGFRFLEDAHLRVVKTNSQGVDADLILGIDFFASGAGEANGSVILVAPLATNERLTILRAVPATQEADYVQNDAFPAESHERALDKLTMIAQQQAEQLGRTLRLGVSVNTNPEFPSPSPNKFIGWDSVGARLVNADIAALSEQFVYAVKFYYTYAQAMGDIANLAEDDLIEVSRDETRAGARTRYKVQAGTLVFVVNLDQTKLDLAAATGASLVGFQQEGTGVVSTTVQSKLREFVSVKDFGAVGDGVTDDASAINAAIGYANSKGGGTVFFPSGAYRVKSSVQYLAGADLIGESMGNTTLKWHPDTNTAGSILDTSNQYLNRARFENLRFTKDATITALTIGILGGSTLANYNSAVACFENLHFDGLTYGIRGDAEPTGVGLFDCYFKNIWCSGCFYGLWLFGSGNRVDQPRMTLCDTAIALDYLNAESYDGMTVTGGTWVGNNYDIGVLSVNGIRPTKFIGCWYETSKAGVINILNPGTRVMNLDFIGCMLSTSSTVSLFNAENAVGTVSIDRCTLISGGLIGGVAASQTVVRPAAAGGRLLIKDCQKYGSVGVASFVSDSNYFEAVKSGVNQSIPSAAYTKLTWAAATIDSAPGFDNANDTYVIPVKGVYRVVASIAFAPHSVSTNNNQVLMYQNGTFRRAAIGASNSSTVTTVTLDCLFAFNAGDTVDIRVLHGNGTAIDVLGVNDLTRFSVQFVSPQ